MDGTAGHLPWNINDDKTSFNNSSFNTNFGTPTNLLLSLQSKKFIGVQRVCFRHLYVLLAAGVKGLGRQLRA